MKLHVAALVISGSLFVVGTVQADEAKEQIAKVQGIWAAVTYIEDGQGEAKEIPASESPVRWAFKNDRVTFLADVETASAKGTYKLDPSKKPKTIDISFPPAFGEKMGQTLLGIYEIDGDALKICYSPDGGQRPAEFQSKSGSKVILATFKRLKK